MSAKNFLQTQFSELFLPVTFTSFKVHLFCRKRPGKSETRDLGLFLGAGIQEPGLISEVGPETWNQSQS